MSTMEKKLTLSFPSDTETLLTRHFNAPRSLVWQCFTQCEHLAKWWGFGLSECQMDLRVGGKWRRVTKSPDGQDVPFEGVYQEIVPNELLSYTLNMPHTPELVETVLLADDNGGTKMSVIGKWPNKQTRDGAAPYMEKGAGQAYDKLEQHLDT